MRDPFQTPQANRPQAPRVPAGGSRKPNVSPKLIALGGGTVVALLAVVVGAYFLFGGGTTIPTGGDRSPRSIVLEPSEKVLFSGKAAEIKAAAGNTIEQRAAGSQNSTVVIRSTNPNARPVNTTEGAFVTVPRALMQELAGKRVRFTVWVRAAEQRPSSRFALAFTSGTAFSSGWIVFTPTPSFEPFTFDVIFPKEPAADGYIGLWSDISGQGGGIELRLVTEQPVS